MVAAVVYQQARAAGRLTVRVSFRTPISLWEAQRDLVANSGKGDELLSLGGFKGYADGSLGSSTAIFFEPYADAPETSGLFASDMFPDGALEPERDPDLGVERARQRRHPRYLRARREGQRSARPAPAHRACAAPARR